MTAFGLDAFLAIPRLLGLAAGPGGRLVAASSAPAGTRFVGALWVLDPDGTAPPRRLTADDASVPTLAPDGSVLFLRRREDDDAAERAAHGVLACSPDGGQVVAELHPLGTPDAPPDRTLVLVDLATGGARDLLPGFDRWPQDPVWTADGAAVLFTADDGGRCLPYRVDAATGTVHRLADEGAFTSLSPAWDAGALWALRSSIGRQPGVVRLGAGGERGGPALVRCPGDDVVPPGRVERVTAAAADGTEVPGWLVLPPDPRSGPRSGPQVRGSPVHEDARAAPLAVLIHGGPLNSLNAWHWRWNPHVLAARGWAVLLADPALSTGYGLDCIRRGWGRWGAEPYTDILTLLDAVGPAWTWMPSAPPRSAAPSAATWRTGWPARPTASARS